MSPRKMLTLLSLLVLIGSAQAQTTDPGPRKDRFWSTGIFGAFGPGTNMTFFPGALVGWSSDIKEYNVGTDLPFFKFSLYHDRFSNPGELYVMPITIGISYHR